MRTTGFLTLLLGIVLLSCNQNNSRANTTNDQIENGFIVETTMGQIENLQEFCNSKDKEEIQNLIRQVLNWADLNYFNLMPMLTDSQDSVYIGFDLNKHKLNLDKLNATGYFANEFIENYNQIILTLDKMYRNHEFEKWHVIYGLPHFGFSSGANEWCACQDVPYDNPNPLDYVEIEVIKLNEDSAQLIWKWGLLELKQSSWNDFSYKFRAVKENDKWKIAYLQEFDFEKITRKTTLSENARTYNERFGARGAVTTRKILW
jgi:hypothetical protein